MKHLSALHQTFPHLPSRSAIMGLVQKKKSPVELAEEEVEVKQRSSQFVTVKVSFTVRPHMPPCHCAVVSLPLAARCSELLETSWGLFLEYREKMGEFIGPAPSEDVNDYMLCFMEQPKSASSYKQLVHEVNAAVAQASTADRRRSSVMPGIMGLQNTPDADPLAIESSVLPIAVEELTGRMQGAPSPMTVSPAQSNLDMPRRRTSRSASVISSATLVTEEDVADAENRDLDDDDDDNDDNHEALSARNGASDAGGVGTTNVDMAIQEFRSMNRIAHAVAKLLPSPQQVCEECPLAAIVSRLVNNRLKKKSEANDRPAVAPDETVKTIPEGVLQTAFSSKKIILPSDHDDGLVAFHLVLKPAFLLREELVLTEEKTRIVTERVFQLSWEGLQKFERQCLEHTKVYEVRRALEVEQIQAFEEKEHQIRVKHMRTEHQTWADSIHEFKKRYNELEVGMIAQYRHMKELRQRHISMLRVMGFRGDDDDDEAAQDATQLNKSDDGEEAV